MKLKLILILFFINVSILSANNFNFAWSLESINNELNLSQGSFSYTFDISVLHFYIIYNERIFLELNPLKYWYFSENNNHKFSFVNLDLFIRIFDSRKMANSGFGPFISINLLENNNLTYFENDIIINSGIRISIFKTVYANHFLLSWADFELAYRKINNKNNIYLGLKFNVSSLPIFMRQ